jgi:hypothetical protein
MRPGSWLLTTTLSVVFAAGAIAAANVALDIYGMYHPARDRHISVLGDPRIAKYLLSTRYVPENFNAVFTGASVAANWEVKRIEDLRVYNEALNGGNIVEEKTLIEAALERPGIQVAFLLVHPSLTYSHEFRTVEMKAELRRSALGSASLWAAYKEMLNIRLGRLPQKFDDAGTETFQNMHSEMNWLMKQMWNAPDFSVDPVALQAYKNLVKALTARRIRIVFVVPPTSEALLATKRVQMEKYLTMMRREIGGDYLWINFLRPEYSHLRDPEIFSDGVHLKAGGARQVVDEINGIVRNWIGAKRLLLATSDSQRAH